MYVSTKKPKAEGQPQKPTRNAAMQSFSRAKRELKQTGLTRFLGDWV